jgi:hypothetical protein
VSEICGGLIAFRAAAFVTKYGSDITVREHFEIKKHLVPDSEPKVSFADRGERILTILVCSCT